MPVFAVVITREVIHQKKDVYLVDAESFEEAREDASRRKPGITCVSQTDVIMNQCDPVYSDQTEEHRVKYTKEAKNSLTYGGRMEEMRVKMVLEQIPNF